ncbi:hypothetical protein CkaCkLH20_11961 [Colletotrichum karsti]|uniref:Uncharacterized protein n=1 Tax=Colletotrichum karsti TaxID=1095194 RepID=A0A9P6I2D6_9PEZI|nr:uncharacterized protein CkaCkLH20_11961 [Colletotrichum karsti]KAF9870655.1 hypothetical protein CkaCkLH20_11961 [Colletotrichum karsti]
MNNQFGTTDSQITLVNTDTQNPQVASPQKKKSLYQRLVGSKSSEISEEDMLKYTGKTKAELTAWAKDRPGVGGNQPAGKVDAGNSTFGVVGLGIH